MRKTSVSSTLIFFILMLFFLALSQLMNSVKSQSESSVQERLQQIVLGFESNTNQLLPHLMQILNNQGIDEFERQALNYQNNNSKHISFFLYKNHQLIFWTNNQLLLPETDSLIKQQINASKSGPHWILSKAEATPEYTLQAIKILQGEYKLQNEYLHDHYLDAHGIRAHLKLSTERGKYEITDSKGTFLFSFQSDPKHYASEHMPYLLFFTFILSFIFFAFWVERLLKEKHVSKLSPWLKAFLFSSIIGLFLFVFNWFSYPRALFLSPLFLPQLYANPGLYSSLGSLFLWSIWATTSLLYISSQNLLKPLKCKYQFVRFGLASLLFAGLLFLYYLLYQLIISLVFDSQISLEINAITKLNFYSYTVLILIMLLQLSWFMLSRKVLLYAYHFLQKKISFVFLAFVFALLFGFLPEQQTPINQLNQLFLFAYFISFYYLFSRKKSTGFWQNVYFLVLFISISGVYYTELSKEKEEIVRKTGLSSYLLKNDPLLESDFFSEKSKLLSDSNLIAKLQNPEFSNDELIQDISSHYFLNAARNYEISMVFCDAQSQLLLMPQEVETPCFPFFEERIRQADDTIAVNSLYLVDQHFRTKNYIGIINFQEPDGHSMKLFVEFLSKNQPKELGIPALLSDAKNWDMSFFSNYAYAYYYDGELSEWFGHFDYKQNLESYKQNLLDGENYFEFDGYSHFVYVQDEHNILVVSKPDIGWLKKVASLAFLFLFYSLNISGLFLLVYLLQNFNRLTIGFQLRLQISMVAVLLFSFFTIGLASLYYLYYLNDEKNKSVLMEKAHSVLIELEHKLPSIDENANNQNDYLQNLLLKFSQVFFTDINLYDLNGRLLASSRPQLFESELLSRRMNPNAFYNLSVVKSSIFMHTEQIGLQEFYSVYIPFRSVDNETVAYLNLPYFAKQNELEEEISGFLVAYLNIYMFLILLTLALTIIISNYLSKPLKLLREKIQRVRLGAKNEKIGWKKEDEIGALIMEYNRMVDELSESAEKLARSQRESAWHEMAQQIAHEIKNPLTPMKLNIQYLERAWKEGSDANFDDKLSRISKNLTEQIDSLSDIATQFSSFAVLDEVNPELISVNTLLKNSVDLFSGHKHITFNTHLPENELLIWADRNQFIRILNNLLKNATQAMSEQVKGIIDLKLIEHKDYIEIQLSDTGCGIPEKEKPHIFEPRFTTKTGGMGLGLSLVKKMTENAGGSIRFESEENIGTRFYLLFPKHHTS